MSAAAYLDRARGWLARIERIEAARHPGMSPEQVRERVAVNVGALPGTLENLRKSRLKVVAADLFDRLRARLVRELETELRTLEHELHVLHASGLDAGDEQVGEIETHLAAARSALRSIR